VSGNGFTNFQHPLRTWAARLRRQAATGSAPAPVLRTKPSESLPHRESRRAADSQIRARHGITSFSDMKGINTPGPALEYGGFASFSAPRAGYFTLLSRHSLRIGTRILLPLRSLRWGMNLPVQTYILAVFGAPWVVNSVPGANLRFNPTTKGDLIHVCKPLPH